MVKAFHFTYEAFPPSVLHDANLILKQSLLDELREVKALYRDESNDHRASKLANREIQNQERILSEALKKLEVVVNRGAFTMVLLDGDGMIFNDQYLRAGEHGGRDAATTLSEHLRNYFQISVKDLPPDFKVIVRIYVNLKGLSEVCYRGGITENVTLLESFFKGFTGSKILYDVIDVGTGKERADSKIAGTFGHKFYQSPLLDTESC